MACESVSRMRVQNFRKDVGVKISNELQVCLQNENYSNFCSALQNSCIVCLLCPPQCIRRPRPSCRWGSRWVPVPASVSASCCSCRLAARPPHSRSAFPLSAPRRAASSQPTASNSIIPLVMHCPPLHKPPTVYPSPRWPIWGPSWAWLWSSRGSRDKPVWAWCLPAWNDSAWRAASPGS